MYPDENTPSRLFNGIPFSNIPICNIKASKNNTIISVTDAKGKDMFVCDLFEIELCIIRKGPLAIGWESVFY